MDAKGKRREKLKEKEWTIREVREGELKIENMYYSKGTLRGIVEIRTNEKDWIAGLEGMSS